MPFSSAEIGGISSLTPRVSSIDVRQYYQTELRPTKAIHNYLHKSLAGSACPKGM